MAYLITEAASRRGRDVVVGTEYVFGVVGFLDGF
jgi:hypothetical protein